MLFNPSGTIVPQSHAFQWERTGKKVKLLGWDKVMHSAIAHHWQLMPNQFLSKQLHPQPTPPILLLGMTSHGIECPFGQSGSSFLVLSLHRCLCTASLLTGSSVWESEKSLILCKHCSAITTTLVCKQHCCFVFFPISKIWHHTSHHEDNYLSWNQKAWQR